MKPFFSVQADSLFIVTTGYTGETDYEIIVHEAAALWQWMLEAIKATGTEKMVVGIIM